MQIQPNKLEANITGEQHTHTVCLCEEIKFNESGDDDDNDGLCYLFMYKRMMSEKETWLCFKQTLFAHVLF